MVFIRAEVISNIGVKIEKLHSKTMTDSIGKTLFALRIFFLGFMPQTFWAKPIYFCKNMQNRLHPASFEIWCSSSFESSTTTITIVKWFNFLFIYPSIHPSIRFFPIRLPFSFPLIFLSIISISIVVFQATFISFAMLELIHKINLSLMQSKSCQFTCIHAHNSFYWISIGPRESILIW